MKKFLLSFLCLMTLFAVKAEEVTFDFVNNTYGMTRYNSGSTYNPKPTTITEGIVTIVLDNGNNRLWSDGLRCYKGTTATISVAAGYAITDVTFTSNGDSSFSSKKNDDNFVISYTPTSSNKAIKTITITYTVNATDSRKDAGLKFPEKELNVNLGSEFTSPVATAFEGAEITYSINNESVATIDAQTGELTIVGAGSATVTATSAETDEYKAGEAEYILNVKDPNALEETFDFVNNTYGMTRLSGNTQEYNPKPTTITEGIVTIVLDNGNNRLWSDGLRCYKGTTATISVAAGYAITDVTFTSNGDSSFSSKKNDDNFVISYTPTSSNKAIQTITVKYAKAEAPECPYTEEELTPIFSRSTVSFDENNQAKIEIPNNDLDGVKIYYKHVPAATENEVNLMSVDHADFTEATHNVENGTHDFTINGAGQVTYYGYHEATDTKGVERTFKVLENGTTGVEGVEVDGEDAAVEYFNLQGVRVENPAAGGLYIRKQGSKVTKVIL